MYPGLSPIISSSVGELSKEEFILIEDNQTDGSFLFHHFISAYIKAGANICLVGFAQTFVHYSSIAKRLGLNLNVAKEKGQLIFIDGMSLFLECFETLSKELQPINLNKFFDVLKTTVESSAEKPTLLILDNISLLVNAGGDIETVTDFMHYCYAITNSQNYKLCLLALVHCDDDVDDGDAIYLRNNLKYYATMHMYVKGLETGYSRDVHGQIEVTRRNLESINTETKTMQYKLNDKRVDFFPLGTSSAVL